MKKWGRVLLASVLSILIVAPAAGFALFSASFFENYETKMLVAIFVSFWFGVLFSYTSITPVWEWATKESKWT